MKYTIGIDEVGRGALAGPVSVGAFCVSDIYIQKIKNEARKRSLKFADSKKQTKIAREEWFLFLSEMIQKNLCAFVVIHQSNKIIDTKGLSYAIQKALNESLKKLKVTPRSSKVLLDGGLHASPVFKNQKTVIKGDEKEFTIMCASIVAKVTRDRYMHIQAKKYPVYGFDDHVGYGTKQHIKNIKKHGRSLLHRESFLTRI